MCTCGMCACGGVQGDTLNVASTAAVNAAVVCTCQDALLAQSCWGPSAERSAAEGQQLAPTRCLLHPTCPRCLGTALRAHRCLLVARTRAVKEAVDAMRDLKTLRLHFDLGRCG